MKIFSSSGTSIIIASLFAGVMAANTAVAAESEYSFKVHNNTRDKITKLLVSEDKKEWGYFDIGQGVAAGGNMTLVWDASTNNEGCDQYVKAVFADGSESEPSRFNFCEANLELEF
jgi:hypothetical protein